MRFLAVHYETIGVIIMMLAFAGTVCLPFVLGARRLRRSNRERNPT